MAHAAGNIGRIYYKGDENLPRDEVKGLYYLDMAAVNGLVEAALFLLNLHRKTDNIEKLIYYANIAAKLGDPTAQEFNADNCGESPDFFPTSKCSVSHHQNQPPQKLPLMQPTVCKIDQK